ncbi:MAG: DNA polymerase III subunit gamma and tau [Dermatophilaceae bacterium]
MATALYRRYRPESFADVIGQEHVTEPLMQALRTGRVNHAYLFSGPRGCGKTTSARILARCLNCEQGPTPIPCGTCDSCVALARGGAGSVDVVEIDAASHGGVDDARDLRERASYGPAMSRYKIYIIDEAHMVTPQGFNALLKIVEEPPEHVKFVFATTEPEKVIGTIRSRTHHYPFRLVPPAKLADYMQKLCDQEGVTVAPGVLSFVTRAGGGSVRDSLSVLDQLIAGSSDEGLTYDSAVALLGFTDGELLDSTIDALAASDGAATFRQIDKVIESGHDPRRFVEDLLERLRDLIIVAAVPEGVGQVLRGVPEDQLERMRVQQATFGAGALSRAADIVNTGLTEMTGANSPRLQLELICARVLLPAASGDQGYAARLDRLERRLDVGGVPTNAPAGGPSRAPGPQSHAPSSPAREATGSQAPAAVASPTGPPPVPSDPSSAPSSTKSLNGDGRPAPADPTTTPGAQPSETPAASSTQFSTPSSGHSSTPSAPAPTTGASSGHSSTPSSGHDAGSPSAGRVGGMDTDALRRAWPDVLGRIFGMRRLTWTFVSQNAQITAFDGSTLTLGIATEGLTATFRAGSHAEVVRQALIDELGVEAVVNGVYLPDSGSTQAPVAPPPGSVPSGPPDPDRAPRAHAKIEAPPAHAPRDPSRGRSGPADSIAPSGPPPDRPDWGSASAAPPPWATADPSPDPSFNPTAAPGAGPAAATPETSLETNAEVTPATPQADPATPHANPATPQANPAPTQAAVRGASGVRASFAQARSSAGRSAARSEAEAPRAPLTDDSAVSDDDENIEVSGDVGRGVIESVLGGRVITEIDE